MNKKDINTFEAIRQGTKEAMWQMITNATDAPCADFYDSIKSAANSAISSAVYEAVYDAFRDALKKIDENGHTVDVMKKAISEGVYKAIHEKD